MGLRREPGRLALVVFRLPLALYQRGWGRLLGGTFLLLVHAGRRTGKLHQMVAMVLRYDPETRERSSAQPGAKTPTGSATSGPARRCGSRSGKTRSPPSSGSCPKRRAWQ